MTTEDTQTRGRVAILVIAISCAIVLVAGIAGLQIVGGTPGRHERVAAGTGASRAVAPGDGFVDDGPRPAPTGFASDDPRGDPQSTQLLATAPTDPTTTTVPATLPPPTTTVPSHLLAPPLTSIPPTTTTTAPPLPPIKPHAPACAGNAASVALARTIVCMAASPSGHGYWLVGADGGVITFGDAGYFGSLASRQLNEPVTGMAATPDGRGYWLVTAGGGVSGFGTAVVRGAATQPVGGPRIVGMAATPTGGGYWLVAADGTVSHFGDAGGFGGMGGRHLSAPVVGMAATPDAKGYWLLGADGGVFTFGNAVFRGAPKLKKPAVFVSIVAAPRGDGYWLTGADGGVFTYGAARFSGSAASQKLQDPIVAMATTPDGNGYWLTGADGGVFSYGAATFLGSAWTTNSAATIVESGLPSGPLPVGIFYYPWYAKGDESGGWFHWNQNGTAPPDLIGSDYYPARGAYSSGDPAVLDAQMNDIALTGVQTVIVSWWGRGSFEDKRLPQVVQAAAAHHLNVALQLEPYPTRSAASVPDDLNYVRTTYGIRQAYVYDADKIGASDWARITGSDKGMRLLATGDGPAMVSGDFEAWAVRAGFDGIYTYTALFPPQQFATVCRQAHMVNLLCEPSVAPGYSASRATGDVRSVDRLHGATYDAYWNWALNSSPNGITITSYNEWHEGTQIEAAIPHCSSGGLCSSDYDGAYGTYGPVAQNTYLGRTTYWIQRLAHPGG